MFWPRYDELNKLALELNQINLSGLTTSGGTGTGGAGGGEEKSGNLDNLFEFLTEVHRLSQSGESSDDVKTNEDVMQEIGDQMDALVSNLEDEVSFCCSFSVFSKNKSFPLSLCICIHICVCMSKE